MVAAPLQFFADCSFTGAGDAFDQMNFLTLTSVFAITGVAAKLARRHILERTARGRDLRGPKVEVRAREPGRRQCAVDMPVNVWLTVIFSLTRQRK